MPSAERSLQITDLYRDRLVRLRDRVHPELRRSWAQTVVLDDLDRQHAAWAGQAAATIDVAQRAAVRLTAAYLAAYLASERGGARTITPVDDSRYAGMAQDGRPLTEAFTGSLIAVKVALKDGEALDTALERGGHKASRLGSTAVMAASREALADAIAADDRIAGWRRVTGGGCLACVASATGAVHAAADRMGVHDHCRCTAEPVVRGVAERAHRPTGIDIFRSLPAGAQDKRYGPEKARLVRDGLVPLEALIASSPMALGPDQITEAPLEALRAQ